MTEKRTKKAAPDKVAIYALVDPSTDQIRYIGKANDAAARYRGHLREARGYPKDCWVRSLIGRGAAPEMVVVEEVPAHEWQEAETFWIAYFRSIGADLLNVALGGDEPYCPSATRAENGRKVAAKRQDTPFARRLWEVKRTIGESLAKGWVTEATKQKLRMVARKRPDLFSEWAGI